MDSNYNYTTEDVHISTIVRGDTVIHEGHMRTVGLNNITYSSFMGSSLFGDSYKIGRTPVKKVIFKKP